MGLRDYYNFEYLINEAERMVLESLEKYLGEEEFKDICKCQDCVLDMAALALNKVKPHYRVSLIGTLYAHNLDDSEYGKHVDEVVKDSVGKISKNPSHD
jgi:competence protein ComFB